MNRRRFFGMLAVLPGGLWGAAKALGEKVPCLGDIKMEKGTIPYDPFQAVRATDDIRVSYDFSRNGWKIEQASTFEWDVDDEVCDPDWQEVAFVESWGREKNTENGDG